MDFDNTAETTMSTSSSSPSSTCKDTTTTSLQTGKTTVDDIITIPDVTPHLKLDFSKWYFVSQYDQDFQDYLLEFHKIRNVYKISCEQLPIYYQEYLYRSICDDLEIDPDD